MGVRATIRALVDCIGEARRAHELYSRLSHKSDAELARMGYERSDLVRAVMERARKKEK